MNVELPAYLNNTAKDVTGNSTTNIFACTGHGFAAGDSVVFSDKTGGTGITAGTAYYVISAGLGTDAFEVSATRGGSVLDFTTDMTAGKVTKVPNWSNLQSTFTPEDRGRLAGWYETNSGGTDLTDSTVFDQEILQDYFLNRRLPDPNPTGPR